MCVSDLVYRDLDLANEPEVKCVARIHCEAPAEWQADHSYSEESIEQTVQRLQNTEKVRKVLLARNATNDIVGLHWVQLDTNPDATIGHLMSLWVHPDYRKRGVATRLKELAETWMRVKGVSEVRTQVYLKNERMLALNEKLGFEAVMVGMSKQLD